MNGVNNMSVIEKYIDAQVAVITLNNSQSGNILNYQSLDALLQAFTACMAEKEARVIVLRSNGDNFCMGMDLMMFQSIAENMPQIEQTVALYIELLSAIYTGSKPVISLINGNVKAGGVGLVGACDIVLASEKASFELSEVFFGLIPANVLPFLYSIRIPLQKIRYLILTAKKLSAKEALQLNLVDEVFAEQEMEKGTQSIIKNLFRASPNALAETKRFTYKLVNEKMDRVSRLAKEKLLEMIKNPEVTEAIKSFNEGNIPKWFAKYKPEKPLIS